MIVAGIDEAGYGPLLGPLVVGGAAFEVEAVDATAPCLWTTLGKCVSRGRSRAGIKIHVNDSKLVYSTSVGLKELERSVLALAGACHGWSASLDELIGRVAPDARTDLSHQRWYGPTSDEKFPFEQEAVSVRLFCNGLRAEMDRTRCGLVYLSASVLPEKRLNQILQATRNKASALFSTASIHIDRLIRRYADRDLVIFCDRQGGRSHYGSLLRLMFEDWALEVTSETEGRSEYVLTQDARRARLIFTEKAESQCMSVAVASMLCKYLRETLMRRFNGWWHLHQPGLVPTAGYYTDGMRFLTDVVETRKTLGVTDDELIRSR